ncbi:MAG: DUF177 domain-containing protein [Acetobacter sp.]|nr:DUF177 domain-containing protein [Acetobacter sp.]
MKNITEFSSIVPLHRIGEEGLKIAIEATPDECRRIAQRMRLPKLYMLRCRYFLQREDQDVVIARGDLAAQFTQVCVVSLEEFEETMTSSFEVRFVPEKQCHHTKISAMDAIDEIPYDGQDIDLGEAAVQQFALELDPYPRAPQWEKQQEKFSGESGEEDKNSLFSENQDNEKEGSEKKASPFAVLSALRDNFEKKKK